MTKVAPLLALALSACVLQAASCVTCHPREVQQYQKTGMARSLSRVQDSPDGEFVQQYSGTKFTIRATSERLRQAAERRGLRAEYPVEYVMGSGNHAFAYLIRISDFLFQSPISYYTKRGVWDMAPGFEHDRAPDFTRPIGPECLLCHAGSSFPAGGINRYKPPVVGEMAISCDRCHGNTEAHAQHPSRANIVNPARLPQSARDSVCEQCHLTGEARVPNPGKTLADFRVGQTLESVFSVYVLDQPANSESVGAIKVVSHAEQLRKSVCARSSSGRLWCGTCHDPHNVPVDKVSYYRDRCLSCHTQPLPQSHPSPSANCVGCHMPSRPAKDGGHTAFTDHQIIRVNVPVEQSGASPPASNLMAWRATDSSIAKRNLALAYLAAGERNDSPELLDKAGALLKQVQVPFASDAEVLNGLGIVLLRQGKKAEAVKMLEKAVSVLPASAPFHINLATALMESGYTDQAITHLNKAIEIDPSLELAYRRLVEVYGTQHDAASVKQTFRRYLQFRPQSIEAREALRNR